MKTLQDVKELKLNDLNDGKNDPDWFTDGDYDNSIVKAIGGFGYAEGDDFLFTRTIVLFVHKKTLTLPNSGKKFTFQGFSDSSLLIKDEQTGEVKEHTVKDMLNLLIEDIYGKQEKKEDTGLFEVWYMKGDFENAKNGLEYRTIDKHFS